MSFGLKLRTLRNRLGMTQIEIAAALDSSQASYSALEQRAKAPSQKWLDKLEAYFQLPPGYFLDGNEQSLSAHDLAVAYVRKLRQELPHMQPIQTSDDELFDM